jgi:hypothetical protein
MALTVATPRNTKLNPNHQGLKSRLLLAAAAQPIQGSAMGFDPATGWIRPLVSGDVLAGINEKTLDTIDVQATGGIASAYIDRGHSVVVVPVTGVAQTDVADRRIVWASDDGTYSFTPGGTIFGQVIGVDATNMAAVQIYTGHFLPPSPGASGYRLLPDVNTTLTTSDLDKQIEIPNSAARTYILPGVARSAGHYLSFIKSSAAAFAATLQGAGAENINGANTNATLLATQYLKGTLYSNGTQWLIVG